MMVSPRLNKSSKRTSLLDLPGELRNRIYRLTVVHPKASIITLPPPSTREKDGMPVLPGQVRLREPALSGTCREVRQEVLSLFYAENQFRIAYLSEYHPRHIQIAIRAVGTALGNERSKKLRSLQFQVRYRSRLDHILAHNELVDHTLFHRLKLLDNGRLSARVNTVAHRRPSYGPVLAKEIGHGSGRILTGDIRLYCSCSSRKSYRIRPCGKSKQQVVARARFQGSVLTTYDSAGAPGKAKPAHLLEMAYDLRVVEKDCSPTTCGKCGLKGSPVTSNIHELIKTRG